MYYPSNHNKDWPIYPTEPAGNNWTIQLATIAYALMMVRLKRPLVRHHDTHTHTHTHTHTLTSACSPISVSARN